MAVIIWWWAKSGVADNDGNHSQTQEQAEALECPSFGLGGQTFWLDDLEQNLFRSKFLTLVTWQWQGGEEWKPPSCFTILPGQIFMLWRSHCRLEEHAWKEWQLINHMLLWNRAYNVQLFVQRVLDHFLGLISGPGRSWQGRLTKELQLLSPSWPQLLYIVTHNDLRGLASAPCMSVKEALSACSKYLTVACLKNSYSTLVL